MSDAATAGNAADDAPPVAARNPDNAALAGDGGEWQGASIANATVTIARPRDEVFAFFRDFSNLPRFMENVERIDLHGAERSHWVVSAPGDKSVEWDATITEEQPGALIAWTAVEGADVPNTGRVTFADAGARGTIVDAVILYEPPAGLLGKVVAKLTQKEPAIQTRRDLRRLKQLLETGEIAISAWTNERARGDRAPAA